MSSFLNFPRSEFSDITLHQDKVIEVFLLLHFLNGPGTLTSQPTEPEKVIHDRLTCLLTSSFQHLIVLPVSRCSMSNNQIPLLLSCQVTETDVSKEIQPRITHMDPILSQDLCVWRNMVGGSRCHFYFEK